MSLFGFGKKPVAVTTNPKFIFFTGTVLTPEEFGYTALSISFKNSIKYTDEWFGSDSIGSTLGLASSIQRIRFGADIFTAMLHVGIYLYHAKYILKIEDSVAERVSNGLSAGLNDLLFPNGKRLDKDFKDLLKLYAYKFSEILLRDVTNGHLDSYCLADETWQSTYELIAAIVKANSEGVDGDVLKSWLAEIDSAEILSSGLWLRQQIDGTTKAAILIMNGDGKISYSNN